MKEVEPKIEHVFLRSTRIAIIFTLQEEAADPL